MSQLDGLNELLTGRRTQPTRDQARGVQEGTIQSVQGGKVFVTLPSFDPLQRFGPIPIPRTSTPPQVGDVCLIEFVGAGISKPWLVAWRAP